MQNLSSAFPSDFLSGFYAVLTMICVNLNYKTERLKPLHLGKMLCKLYLNCSAYLQNIFCFEAYLLNLYSIDSQSVQVNMLWKEVRLYLCSSSVPLDPWDPTQNIQNAMPGVFFFFLLCDQFNSSTAAFTKNGEFSLSNNSTEAKIKLLFWFT